MARVDPAEVLTRTADPPDAVLRYADRPEAVIDVHLPPRPAAGPPLVVLIHGGFWRAGYDRIHTRPLANALAAEGCVVASPEYRRVGGAGEAAGGWPATFEDISAVMSALPVLLAGLGLGPGLGPGVAGPGLAMGGTTVAGHSAGGHLALWLANEAHRIDRVVALAPVGDLRGAARDHVGADAVRGLLGGSPEEVPERYDAADPATRFSDQPGCEVIVLHGADDTQVPVANSRGLASRHPTVVFQELAGVGHYGLIDPLSSAWPIVRAAVTRR